MPARCLVTGATGYIGGRLVPVLLERGHQVRAMTRSGARLRDVPWASRVEVAEADAADPSAVRSALEGVDVAYYLIHSIGSGAAFEETDRVAARTFAAAARSAGVRRVIYLGGLADAQSDLSPHLRSRAEVGRIMLESGVPTAVLQAAVILGSGSASFEMLRYLTERLPAMITPKWVHTRIQPIAVGDVLHYLAGCVDLPAEVSRRFDVGGPDVLTYVEMMQRYAAVAGFRRRIIVPVPVLSPRLSALWVNVVTPVPGAIARPLVESLRNEVVCRENDIVDYVGRPPGGPLSFEAAVSLALQRIGDADVATRWSSASWPGAPSDPLPSDPDWAGGSLYVDARERVVASEPEDVWSVITRIGGDTGWYSWPMAWAARGLIDRLVGGVGLRRGRRSPTSLIVGEALDFWRVEEICPGEMLRLRAEMKLPGLAWLELGVRTEPGADGTPPRTVYAQRALFHPRGFAGHAYWRAIAPFHGVIFGGMVRNVAAAAERRAATRRTAAGRSAGGPASGG